MNINQFLDKYKIPSNDKNNTHSSMKGGKWTIPENKIDEFYNLIASSESIDIPIVEKIMIFSHLYLI